MTLERPSDSPVAPNVRAEVEIANSGAVARVHLNRPRALNAATIGLRADIAATLPRTARDPNIYALAITAEPSRGFCAGGDLREMTGLIASNPAGLVKALGDEYALSWLHDCFSKPTAAFINGIVMGSGVGLSLYGTHRVAGEAYKFAMPETGIGFMPDCGIASTFARMPNEIGMYLGLTGRMIDRADALRLGLVTHCINADRFEEIIAALADAEPIDPLLDDRHEAPGPAALEAYETTIARCFSGSSATDIIRRLEAESGPNSAWASETAAHLRRRSPLALAVSYRFIRDARNLDLRQTLMLDHRLGCRLMWGADFREGVRAVLIDKDGKPRWQPETIEDVTPAMVDAIFAPLETGALELPDRKQMQEARV
jgi:enoyl-CoA hydratase